MAWKIIFNGTTAYMTMPLWSTTGDFLISGRYDHKAETQILFGAIATNQCYIATISTGDFRIRLPSGTYNIPGVSVGDDKPFLLSV